MYLPLLIFCTCGSIIHADYGVDSDDETKFIDLLPDDEKNAFIESVARRLYTGVKTKDSRYKSDEEISDETLNQNNQFIQQVLEEEASNIRRDGKSKIDSNEKLNIQGLEQDSKELDIQDDDDKDHIDLTLRSHRTKRNEKDVRNKEFIPVKTVYDEEPVKTKTNKIDEGDGNQDLKQSKEHVDENSTTEDIQVRGPRSHAKGSQQTRTTHPDIQEPPNKATMIVDFEPDEIHLDTSTEKEDNQALAVKDVTVRAKASNDVISGYNGFTQPIFDSEKSDNDGDTSTSNERVKSISHTTSTTTPTEITKPETTEHSTTTQNVITEFTTDNSESHNSTNKNRYLRMIQDEINLEKDPKNVTGETKNVTNTSYEKSFEEVKTSNDNIVMKDAAVQINNENLLSLSNDTNLTTENENNSSEQQDHMKDSESDVNNDNGTFNRNISVKKDDINFDIKNSSNNISDLNTTRNSTETDTSLRTGDVNSKKSSVEINKKDAEDDKAEKVSETNKNVVGTAEQLGEEHKIKNENGESKGSKQYSEFLPLKENNNYLTTTELSIQASTTEQYVIKEVNSSYNSNNLGSSITSDNNNTNINNIQMDLTELNLTLKDDVRDKVLTTTEQMSLTQTHTVYYSKYVSDDLKEVSAKNHSDNDKEGNTNKEEGTHILNYKNQNETLKEITKILRHRLIENNDQSEESKPMLLQSSGNRKEYLVYEIPADEIPFVPAKTETKSTPEPEEQPYYVPVYNYAPSNAYYNAYNRLGPNDEDNDKIIEKIQESEISHENIEVKSTESFYNNLDGHRVFKFNSKKHREKLKVTHSSNSFGFPIVIKKPKVTEIYFNPDEYLDMDYYFERSRRPEFRTQTEKIRKSQRYERAKLKKTHDEYFPDSLEAIHPYKSMAKNDVKNHINAVRQMLYEQKYFGYVPDRQLLTSSSESSSDEHRVQGKKPHDDDHKHSKHSNELQTKHDHDNEYKYENNNNTIVIIDHNHNASANKHENSYRHGHKHKHHGGHGRYRAENPSDYVVLVDNIKKNKRKPSQRDISLDYYFGVYDKDSYSKGKRYEDVLREGKEETDDKIPILNKTLLHDLVDKIKRRRKVTRKGGQSPKEHDKHKTQNKSAEGKKLRKNSGTIKELLHISTARDVFPALEKLMQLNLPLMRRTESEEEVEVYVNVLRDMVKMDSRALKKFDWLGSTVDVLGAVKKLKYLTKYHLSPDIHPLDWELFKYVVYLYKTSKSALEEFEEPTLRNPKKAKKKKKKLALPRNKHKKKEYLTKGLLNRVWLYIRDRNVTENDMSRDDLEFLQFLDDLEDSLFDLYTAIKHIALVTNYERQQWFTNLKSLYLQHTDKKEILELLLHIFTTRLLELIENSANGVEEGFIRYIEQNVQDVDRTRQEFVFILKLMKKIKAIKD